MKQLTAGLLLIVVLMLAGCADLRPMRTPDTHAGIAASWADPLAVGQSDVAGDLYSPYPPYHRPEN